MQNSSFKLTNKEFELILDTKYPLLKKNAIDKIHLHLRELGEQLSLNTLVTSNLYSRSFKISKGENYMLLPYMVLDLPKIEGNNFPILCRTMFWWGKYFSFNVFIRKDAYDMATFENKLRNIKPSGIFILLNDKPWQQDMDSDDYKEVSDWSEKINIEGAYLKLSMKHPIADMETLSEKATYYYSLILSCLQKN